MSRNCLFLVCLALILSPASLSKAGCYDAEHNYLCTTTPNTNCDCNNNCCGTGSWNTNNVVTDSGTGNTIEAPDYEIYFDPGHTLNGSGTNTAIRSRDAGSLSVSAAGVGNCGWALLGGPFNLSASATQNTVYTVTHVWPGPGSQCARPISLVCTGGGSTSLSASVACAPGNTAACNGQGNMCGSSLGDAAAGFIMPNCSITVQYMSGSVKKSGNWEAEAGLEQSDNNISTTGGWNSEKTWTTTGTGSATGGASYSVRAGRTYTNCCYSGAVTKQVQGSASCSGTGTFTNSGSANFNVTCSVSMAISG